MRKSWKIEPGCFYIRRRDKVLVTPKGIANQVVEYSIVKTGVSFKVTIAGFRLGFRPALPEEIPNEVASTVGAGDAGE